MPKSEVRSTRAGRRGKARKRAGGQTLDASQGSKSRAGRRSPAYPCVVRDGRVSHVLVPIAEYERMIESDMIETAIRRLDDPQDQWVDAGQAAMELAGQRIAQARKAAGLTQKQLGDKLKLPQSQISRIERNPDHTTVRTLKRIARALGVDVAALLG